MREGEEKRSNIWWTCPECLTAFPTVAEFSNSCRLDNTSSNISKRSNNNILFYCSDKNVTSVNHQTYTYTWKPSPPALRPQKVLWGWHEFIHSQNKIQKPLQAILFSKESNRNTRKKMGEGKFQTRHGITSRKRFP